MAYGGCNTIRILSTTSTQTLWHAWGGVGVIFQNGIRCADITAEFKCYASFELLAIETNLDGLRVSYYLIYRPPPSASNNIKKTHFITDFSDFLETIASRPGHFCILGDFNIPWDKINDSERKGVASLLAALGLSQHVSDPTHNRGHTIDYIITKSDDNILTTLEVGELVSDHHLINAFLDFAKPDFETKVISYRKIKAIDTVSFSNDILAADLLPDTCDNIAEAIETYNNELKRILDKHAPIKRSKLTLRPKQPWFNEHIKTTKKAKRKAERKLRAKRRILLKLTHDKHGSKYQSIAKQVDEARAEYVAKRDEYVSAIGNAKETYFQAKIDDCGYDQKKLFSVLNEILHKKKQESLPEHTSAHDLAETFNRFFIEKIQKIRSELDSNATTNTYQDTPCLHRLDMLTPCTLKEMEVIIRASSNASCELDPIPTPLLKKCLPVLLPCLTQLVNLSLESGNFPAALKSAIVRPLLKKSNLDTSVFKNYRPVSNIPYVSKLIEKIVVKRIDNYMTTHHLHEQCQSAYRKHHGTETALVKIHNDILRSLDEQRGIVLVMLDLSAAFDTIDHNLLLNRLRTRLGVEGVALRWLSEYYKDRTQATIIKDAVSGSLPLQFGAPQGSIIGPEDYKIYTLPVGDITRKNDLVFHGYADDSGNYISFKLKDQHDLEQALCKVEQCTSEIKEWMTQNKLKLNDTKTEVLVISHPYHTPLYRNMDIKIADATVQTTEKARTLGVMFDRNMNMVAEIESRCKSLMFHLRSIRAIRRFINKDACEKLVHALISSRLDYANSLLFGLPKCLIHKLQLIQNIAARIITGTRKYDHITPVLKSLHWLPIAHRIEFKLNCLTFRIIHGQAPVYLKDLINQRSCRALRSSSKITLMVPKSRTRMYGDRYFSIAAPRLWNNLPENLRTQENYNKFRKDLKTHLFKKAYNL